LKGHKAKKPQTGRFTQAQPHGRRVGVTHCSNRGATLNVLNVPHSTKHLLADNNTLLHEMIHAYLNQRGEHSGHDGESWRCEIMRLHKQITTRFGPVDR
jgi:hypothetical protein